MAEQLARSILSWHRAGRWEGMSQVTLEKSLLLSLGPSAYKMETVPPCPAEDTFKT